MSGKAPVRVHGFESLALQDLTKNQLVDLVVTLAKQYSDAAEHSSEALIEWVQYRMDPIFVERGDQRLNLQERITTYKRAQNRYVFMKEWERVMKTFRFTDSGDGPGTVGIQFRIDEPFKSYDTEKSIAVLSQCQDAEGWFTPEPVLQKLEEAGACHEYTVNKRKKRKPLARSGRTT